jgi:hypothetical protein
MSHIRRAAIGMFHVIFCCNMKKDKLAVTYSMHGRSKGGKIQNFCQKIFWEEWSFGISIVKRGGYC